MALVYNDAERTMCDLLRSRNRIDEETVISAINNYAKSNNIAAKVVLPNYMFECFLVRLSVSTYGLPKSEVCGMTVTRQIAF